MPKNRFSSYSLGVILTVIIAILVTIWFGMTSKSNVKHLELHWNIDEKHATDSAHAINQIYKNFGYGGFIHNFKNFVLRRDSSRIPLIDANLSETYAAIKHYKALAISQKERDAIAQFHQTVDLYAKKYTLARQLVSQGLSSDLIDAQVRVDDGAALQALQYLSKSTLEHSRAINDETSRDMFMMTAFVDWVWFVIPFYILAGAMVIFMLQRLNKVNGALQQAKQYADDLLKAAPDALMVVNSSSDIISANIEAQTLFGYSMAELSQLKLEQLLPERFRRTHTDHVKHSFARPKSRALHERSELVALTRDGNEVPIEISLSYTTQNGELLSIAAIRNITARKQIEQRLRLARKVLDDTSEAIMITDGDTHIVDMNEAFCQLTGYENSELLGQRPSILRSGQHDQTFYQQMWHQLNSHGHWKGELWDRRKDGQLVPNLVSISKVTDGNGQATNYVAVFSDITQIKEKEQRLEQLAHFDQLTGLANRMLFHDRLQAALHRAHRQKSGCAVFYIDLDGFKQVNDTLGHEQGDAVLIDAANRINHIVREDDTAARLGGDEFAIVFNQLQENGAAEILAARILEHLTFEINAGAVSLHISASIGIAIYPDHGDSAECLLRCADQAMYYCKQHGKHGFHRFSKDINYDPLRTS